MINFSSPLFVSIVLHAIYALLFIAVGVTVWSAVSSWRRGAMRSTIHGIRSALIGLVTAGALVTILVVSWLLGSTKPLTINGNTYTDTFWLRTSDMMINTALILMAVLTMVAVLSAAISFFQKDKNP